MLDEQVKYQKILTRLVITISIIAIAWFFQITGAVIQPFVIALLLVFILNPMVERMVKWNFPRIIAIILVILLLVGMSTLIFLVLYESIQSVISVFPKYQDRYQQLINFIRTDLAISTDFLEGEQLLQNLFSLLIDFSGSALRLLGSFAVVLIFLLFMFMEKPFLRRKLYHALEIQSMRKVLNIFSLVSKSVGRYLLVKFIVSFLTGISVFFGFWAVGVDFPFMWGVLTFIFNFIPNIGSIAISIITAVFAVIQFFPEIEPIILAILSMVIPQLVVGNIIDPKMLGDRLNLSPVVILLALLLWGWIWGIAGLFLAVPLTVAIKIIFENTPSLHSAGILMGSGQHRTSLTIPFGRRVTKHLDDSSYNSDSKDSEKSS